MLDSQTTCVNESLGSLLTAKAEAMPDHLGNAALLRCVIEHVDYGLALIRMTSRRLQFANTSALLAMSGEGSNASGLCLMDGRVSTLRSPDERQFERSITLARTGVRGLLNLATQGARTTVAVVPLGQPADDDDALLIFAKRQLCDSSAMALFARACELTAAESSVLASVCTGLRPHEVARRHGVQVSTVRSQLRSIRQKTRSKTVRELVETVSLLPPIARHLS
jgi:DNA-binding CsgD family transcriptional regulator